MDSSEFAIKIRSKYPGAYDKLSDDELTSKVLDKYPQYKEIVGEPSPAKTMLSAMNNMTHSQKIDLLSKSNREYGEAIKNSVENMLTKGITAPFGDMNIAKIPIPGVEKLKEIGDIVAEGTATGVAESVEQAGYRKVAPYAGALVSMLSGPGTVSAILDKAPKNIGDLGVAYATGLGMQAAEAKLLEATKDSKILNTPLEYLWNKFKYRVGLPQETSLAVQSSQALDQAVAEGKISLKEAMQSDPAIKAREMKIRNTIIGSQARAEPIDTLKAITPPEQWDAQNQRYAAGAKAISDKWESVSGSQPPPEEVTKIINTTAETEARLRAGIKPIIRSSPQEHSSPFPDFVGDRPKVLQLHPFGGADEPQTAPEPPRPPITPQETAHVVLQAEIMAPGSSQTVQAFPRLYSAITGISHVPEQVSSRLGAMQGSINAVIGAKLGTPITPQSFHKAMSTGKINFIEADEIDKAIFQAEATYSGIPGNLQGPLYQDSKAAAAKPVESLVVQHFEDTLKKGISGGGAPPSSPPTEFHKMSKEDFVKEAQKVSGGAITPQLASQVYQDIIGRAMEEGESVPQNVLESHGIAPKETSTSSPSGEPSVSTSESEKTQVTTAPQGKNYPESEALGPSQWSLTDNPLLRNTPMGKQIKSLEYDPASTGWQAEKESGRAGIVASRVDDIIIKTASGKFKAYAEEKLVGEFDDLKKAQQAVDRSSNIQPKQIQIEKPSQQLAGTSQRAARGAFVTSEPQPARLTPQQLMPVQSPELFKLTKEILGKFPSLSGRMTTSLGVFKVHQGEPDIKLKIDIAANPEQAMKTLAHEIGHAWQWFSKEESKGKTLIESMYSLKDSVSQVLLKTPYLRKELTNFSEYWRPYDKDSASSSYITYRNSSDEIISDAMSALLTSPGELQKMAPKTFQIITDNIDLEQKFHDAFMKIQGMLNGDSDEVLKARDSDINEMFKSGRDIETEALTKRAASNLGDWKMRIMQQHDNKYYPWLKLQEEAMKAGQPVDPYKDLRHVFESSEYRNKNNYVLADDIRNKVYAPLQAKGLNESDLGKYMLYRWIIEGRKVVETVTDSATNEVIEFERTIFNPLGHTPETAKQGLDFMRRSLGEEKYGVVVQASNALHDLGFPTIERMHEAGMISDEMYPKLVENRRNYATFAVQKYLEENPNISATIKAMKGTVQEVENPAVAYIKKIMAQNQAVESQLAKKAGVEFLQNNFKDEIKPTKVVNKIERPERGKGQLKLYEKGKWVSYDVDPYLAMSFERTDPRKMDMAITILSRIQNGIFKPMWTSLNLGFTFISSPLRYTQRTLELNPELPIGQYLKEYMKARSEAKEYALGRPSEFVRGMIQSGELEPYLGRHEIEEMVSEDEQMKRIFKRFGLEHSINPSPQNIFMRAFNWYAEHMRTASETATTAHKIAAKKIIMSKGGTQGPELSYQIRHYVGMPSTKVRGLNSQTDEAIFTFFNILKEHYRTSYQRAVNPNTAAGFWMRSAMFVIIPKLLMRAAKEGYFGDSVKQHYDRVTEYDMMKYIVFPIGKVKGGDWGWKALYSRFPSSDIDSIIGPLVWKLTDPKLYEGKKDPVTDLLQPIMSDLPSLNPTLKMTYAYMTFLTGNAPYDFFRSRPIVSQQVMNRPGLEKYKKMLQWSINETGFSDFASYDPSRQSSTEIALQMMPGINRLIKTSDYGKTQALKEEINETPQAADISALLQKKRDQDGKLSREDMHKLAVLRFQARQYRLPIKQKAKREKAEAAAEQ